MQIIPLWQVTGALFKTIVPDLKLTYGAPVPRQK